MLQVESQWLLQFIRADAASWLNSKLVNVVEGRLPQPRVISGAARLDGSSVSAFGYCGRRAGQTRQPRLQRL